MKILQEIKMAGHSKWHNIKHKKAKEDSKKAVVFTKISKEITVSCKANGGDPSTNITLRLLLDKARENNMPKENIERAIKKGTGQIEGVNYENILYEGYAPEGVAIIVTTLTDNKNRTISDLRHFFSRNNCRLADPGAVSWMFELQGQIEFQSKNKNEEELLDILLETDLIELKLLEDDQTAFVTCNVENLDKTRIFIEKNGFTIKSAELVWTPKTKTHLDDESKEKVLEFLDKLDDLDDVKDFFINME